MLECVSCVVYVCDLINIRVIRSLLRSLMFETTPLFNALTRLYLIYDLELQRKKVLQDSAQNLELEANSLTSLMSDAFSK